MGTIFYYALHKRRNMRSRQASSRNKITIIFGILNNNVLNGFYRKQEHTEKGYSRINQIL